LLQKYLEFVALPCARKGGGGDEKGRKWQTTPNVGFGFVHIFNDYALSTTVIIYALLPKAQVLKFQVFFLEDLVLATDFKNCLSCVMWLM
jgi:hypothetical protein